jgi:hypothetical protein
MTYGGAVIAIHSDTSLFAVVLLVIDQQDRGHSNICSETSNFALIDIVISTSIHYTKYCARGAMDIQALQQ